LIWRRLERSESLLRYSSLSLATESSCPKSNMELVNSHSSSYSNPGPRDHGIHTTPLHLRLLTQPALSCIVLSCSYLDPGVLPFPQTSPSGKTRWRTQGNTGGFFRFHVLRFMFLCTIIIVIFIFILIMSFQACYCVLEVWVIFTPTWFRPLVLCCSFIVVRGCFMLCVLGRVRITREGGLTCVVSHHGNGIGSLFFLAI
jgi:hypothetical protein